MSENVVLMQKGIEAWNRRDIEGFLRDMHPEIRFEHRLAALEGQARWHGCPGLAEG